MKDMLLTMWLILFLGVFILFFAFAGDDIRTFFSPYNTVVPVKVHIVEEETGVYTSYRDEENIREMFKRANDIWKKSGIEFEISSIVRTRVSFETIPNAINGNYLPLSDLPEFDNKTINAFFVQSLNNINGQALIEINSVLISDHTTANSYRTLAHELGHILGLVHVSNKEMLMAQGENGEQLTLEEIKTAKENLKNFG